MSDEADTAEYLVVVSSSGQYSVWPAERPLPAGWQAEGTRGTKVECLARIQELWTGQRPGGSSQQAEEAS